jgi:hypothetical protein
LLAVESDVIYKGSITILPTPFFIAPSQLLEPVKIFMAELLPRNGLDEAVIELTRAKRLFNIFEGIRVALTRRFLPLDNVSVLDHGFSDRGLDVRLWRVLYEEAAFLGRSFLDVGHL